jgi:uncharacterized protein (TIGR02058 family)
MPAKCILLEIGTGNDLHGGDYTKAAVRALEDAVHHSSLVMLRTFKIDASTMRVDMMVGVQRSEKVNPEVVKAALPHGQVTMNAVSGGLDVCNDGPGELTVIASAAITVHVDLDR